MTHRAHKALEIGYILKNISQLLAEDCFVIQVAKRKVDPLKSAL